MLLLSFFTLLTPYTTTIMKVYTKKGDGGETSLLGGTRVKKNHARIEAYGTVDELNSFIGLIRDSAKYKDANVFLEGIQNDLFAIGSALAADPAKNNVKFKTVEAAHIQAMEKEVDQMEEELPALKNFILPGGDLTASFCHTARCVCRRAERAVVYLNELEGVENILMQYLNRLSDYLFVLARFYTLKQGGVETLWQTRD